MDIERESEATLAVGVAVDALAPLVDGLAQVHATIAALAGLEAALLTDVLTITAESTKHLREPVREREMALRSVSAEIAALMRVSDRTVQRRLGEAWTLTQQFPATHEALCGGQISSAHAGAILDAGSPIETDELRAEFEVKAVALAAASTPGRLRAMLAPIAEQLRTVSLDDRHREARRERRVEVRDLPDGMSELWALLPSPLAHGIHDRLSRYARPTQAAERAACATVRTPRVSAGAAPAADGRMPGRAAAAAAAEDCATSDATNGAGESVAPRTLDQIRADVLCDLALSGAPATTGDELGDLRAHVTVTVPALALAGATSVGAELTGSGALDAHTARALAAVAPGWDRAFTHPETGAVLAVDRYRPSEEIRRTIRVRDRHCRFPGCRIPAKRCDIDHTIDAAHGGRTAACNLACLCRRHHSLKHHSRWRVRNDGMGVLTWTSPLGRTYIDTPHRSVMFREAHDPPGAPPPRIDEPPPF